MANIKDLKPHKLIGPGYHIQEQMELRGWGQAELAEVLGVSVKTISLLLRNKQSITFDIAVRLHEAFNLSVQYWLNLETNYRLRIEQKKQKKSAIGIRSKIYEFMPVSEMMKKGWLEKTSDASHLEKQVLRFWKLDTLDFSFMQKNELKVACRKSEAYTQFNSYALQCWFQMAKNCAEKITAPAYNKEKLNELYDKINEYTVKPEGVELFLKKLNACGVKFFTLSHLQKTYLDGAAFYDKGNPVVVYTARYKRDDNFWFTLAHEVAHVLLHLKKTNDYYLDNLAELDESKREQDANSLAQEHLRHNEILDYFTDKMQYVSTADVKNCAVRFHISPSVVVGALAHEKKISYALIHQFSGNPLEAIPEKYLVEK